MGEHRDLDVEERGAHGASEEWLVALVVRVRNQRHAGGYEFWTCGVDGDDVAVGSVERDGVVGAVAFTVFELGLGDGCAERHVPQRRGFCLVGLTTVEVAQERALRHGARSLVDGLVGQGPVDREPELSPQLLEDLLVLFGEALAELDEVAS